MKLIIPILAIMMIVLIAGCANNTPSNTPVINSSVAGNTANTTTTVTLPASVSGIDAYANTSLIDQGIDELNQVE
jgi:ABC-type Fe3+-hydroxamate transport system substrate-binding protein